MAPKHLLCILALLLGLSAQAHAACRNYKPTPADQVRIQGDSVLIVTHATAAHDPRFSTKHGVDMAVKWAKERSIPIIYLVDESPIDLYLMDDCHPTYWVNSNDGDIAFPVRQSNIYFAGGHLEMCLSRTIHDVLMQAAQRKNQSVRFTYFMDAIYSNGKSVEPDDPFYRDFGSFLSVVTYGRPGGETWPKLSLLETLGVIKSLDHDYRYLTKILPRWDNTLPDGLHVDLRIEGTNARRLRSGPGLFAPRFEFLFVESATALQ